MTHKPDCDFDPEKALGGPPCDCDGVFLGVVRVGGVTYDIWEMPLDGLYGRTRFDVATIEICPGLAPERFRATLLHEIVHAALFEAGETESPEPLTTALSLALGGLIPLRLVVQFTEEGEARCTP